MRPALLLLLAACSGSTPTPPPTPAAPEAPAPPAPEVTVVEDPQLLSELQQQVTVAVGAVVGVRFSEHGSVGESSAVDVADPAVLEVTERRVVHANPERMAAGMSGADASTVTVVLTAVAPGTTTVTRTDDFRGQTQGSTTWTVTVTD